MDWKEYRLSYTKKAAEIMKSLSLEEKVSLMSGNMSEERVKAAIQRKLKVHYNEEPYEAGGIPEKGIPPVCFADGTRGVVCGRGETVCFPVTAMRGASFDIELEEKVGEAIAEEVLAAGGNLFGGVCVNLPYHPGWGRVQEVYGEDTCLLGEMGAALVRGVQKSGVIACVKHFAFNSMENVRFEVNISCNARTEREIFLAHFKKCIEAGAGAVMSAYNSYKGELCGHHRYLLNQVLKEDWGFDGFVMSDFNWGIKDTKAAVNAGMDMEMPNTHYYGENLVRAVKSGDVDEKTIDEAVLRIVRTLLAHKDIVECAGMRNSLEEHIALSLRCAREGMTLLRNENHVLPITGKRAEGRIIVLGELANGENTGDRGSSQVYAPYVVTPLQGITKMSEDAEVIYYSGESAAHCKRLASKADVVIIVAGNDYRDEGECVSADADDIDVSRPGGDRIDGLGLKTRDINMIDAVSEVRKDAVVVLIGGGTIMMSDWHEKVGAVLLAYYPGMEGGTALGEVLFGKVNPGGKLPFVIPEKETDLPEIDWNAKEQTYDYFHGYTLLDKRNVKPLYPFGFGLSYTSFEISNVKVWEEDGILWASADIRNTGKMPGAEVLQMYVGAENSSVERPIRALKAFQKVFLKKGEQKKVVMSCGMEDLAYYDEKESRFVLEHTKYEVYVGTSSAELISVLLEI